MDVDWSVVSCCFEYIYIYINELWREREREREREATTEERSLSSCTEEQKGKDYIS